MAKSKVAKKQPSDHKQGRRKRFSFLSGLGDIGIPTKWADFQVLSTFEKAGLFLIGYVGGKEIDRRFIKSGDQEGFKKFIAPVLFAGGGVVLANMKGDAMRFIGYGLATAGVVSGVNNALGKGKDITNLDTLKGFSLGDLLGGKTDFPVYRDPVILKLPPYKPSLPELSTTERAAVNDDYEQEVRGIEEEPVLI